MNHSQLRVTVVSDEMTTISITCFSDEVSTMTKDCNEVLAETGDKNPYQLPSSLKALENNDSSTIEAPKNTIRKALFGRKTTVNDESTAKDDLRKAFEKCNEISQESRALIDSFLKEESDKDYQMNHSMYGKAPKKQMNAKFVWLWEKYN
nr:hypothetical protein [Tanacetum cinerariifolium]